MKQQQQGKTELQQQKKRKRLEKALVGGQGLAGGAGPRLRTSMAGKGPGSVGGRGLGSARMEGAPEG